MPLVSCPPMKDASWPLPDDRRLRRPFVIDRLVEIVARNGAHEILERDDPETAEQWRAARSDARQELDERVGRKACGGRGSRGSGCGHGAAKIARRGDAERHDACARSVRNALRFGTMERFTVHAGPQRRHPCPRNQRTAG